MQEVDHLKCILDGLRPLPEKTERSLKNSLLLRYNQASNAMEGNSLTLIEAKVLLEQGVTADSKPFKDHLDIINHQQAINYLLDLVKDKAPLSERIIKNFNALLLKSTQNEQEAGQYRRVPLALEGAEHIPLQPDLIQKAIEDLVLNNQANINARTMHPVERIVRLHADFMAIYPFAERNCRTGRLIMNLELMKEGYPIAIIAVDDRAAYYQAMNQAAKGDYAAIQDEICKAIYKALAWELDVVHPDWKTA